MNDYQGKTPKQVKDSENFMFWTFTLLALTILGLLLTK